MFSVFKTLFLNLISKCKGLPSEFAVVPAKQINYPDFNISPGFTFTFEKGA